MIVTFEKNSLTPYLLVERQDTAERMLYKIIDMVFKQQQDKVYVATLEGTDTDESTFITCIRQRDKDNHDKLTFLSSKTLDDLVEEADSEWLLDFDLTKEIFTYNPRETRSVRVNLAFRRLTTGILERVGGATSSRSRSLYIESSDTNSRHLDSRMFVTKANDHVIAFLGIVDLNTKFTSQCGYIKTVLPAGTSTHMKIAKETNQVIIASDQRDYSNGSDYNTVEIYIQKNLAYTVPKWLEYIAVQQIKHCRGLVSASLISLLDERAKAKLRAQIAMKNLNDKRSRDQYLRNDYKIDGLAVFNEREM